MATISIAKGISVLTLLGCLYTGYKGISNISNWHNWDKQVTKYLEVANGAMNIAKSDSTISMEESLELASENAKEWGGKNTALIWQTPSSDTNQFIDVTEIASQRCKEIGQLEEALHTGSVSEDETASWVKETVFFHSSFR